MLAYLNFVVWKGIDICTMYMNVVEVFVDFNLAVKRHTKFNALPKFLAIA